MRNYCIPIKRVVIETAQVWVRARDKGVAVALALSDAAAPGSNVIWGRKKPDVGVISLDTRVPSTDEA